jgi:hypothetical protein
MSRSLFLSRKFAVVALAAALISGLFYGWQMGLGVYLAANLLSLAPHCGYTLGAATNNTVDAGLKKQILLDTFLEAYRMALLPFSAFSTDFSDQQVREGDKVDVGYIPLADAARVFGGSYTIQKSDYQVKSVTIDKHQYVSWGLKDSDLYSKSIVSLQAQFRQKAFALASAVLTDVLGVVKLADFGAAVFTGAAAGFDLDDVADIRTAVVKAKWPQGARALILGADYYGNVVKENNFQDVAAAGTSQVRETGKLPRLYTFDTYETESIPDNGENLVGMACMPSAIAVASRYLAPRRPEKYLESRALKDTDTGLTVGFRNDYNTETGVEWMVFEANYGFSKLETAALKRIVSA